MPLNSHSESDAKVLSSWLSAEPLKRLIKGAENHQVLQQLISDVVPNNISDNITFYQIDSQQIVLAVTSASWATRLRAHRNDLLFAAERYFKSLGRLTDLKILVRPPQKEKPVRKQKQHAPPKPATGSTIELIQATAGNCSNEALKSALSHLATNMRVYTDKAKGG